MLTCTPRVEGGILTRRFADFWKTLPGILTGIATVIAAITTLQAQLDPFGIHDPLRSAVCADGIDNDHDGRTDYPADSGCSSRTDRAEKTPPCADGRDNDHDGAIDYPDDSGCSSREDNVEKNPACADGSDNDHDGATDYPQDADCSSRDDTREKR